MFSPLKYYKLAKSTQHFFWCGLLDFFFVIFHYADDIADDDDDLEPHAFAPISDVYARNELFILIVRNDNVFFCFQRKKIPKTIKIYIFFVVVLGCKLFQSSFYNKEEN